MLGALKLGALPSKRIFQSHLFIRTFGGASSHSSNHDHSHSVKCHDNHSHETKSHSHAHGNSHGHDEHGHGHDAHHHGPHVSEPHAKAAKFVLIAAYLWVMFRFKEDNGQIFGYYQPWLHEHHHDHYHFIEGENGRPKLVHSHDDEEDDDDDDDHHE